ncbi:hypothetical protein K440DRAFT_626645 [Wilcoxina mikolae CBS 423.85]|nr:hypothetical protein K440DRAFT_626645 [Wilcoxina mikolae CBS 423.85]
MSSNHDIEHFDVALRCIDEGFHVAFKTFGSDFTNYPVLCATLQRLKVDVLGGALLHAIIDHFKRFQFNDEATRIADNLEEDWVFKFLYVRAPCGPLVVRGYWSRLQYSIIHYCAQILL